MVKKFLNYSHIQFIILALTGTIFYREVFSMHFWKDDYALLYNLQQNAPFYYPYQHLVDLHKLLYSLFGLNSLGYFIIGLLFLLLSAAFFYFFIKQLFSSKKLAFLGTLVYLTNPIGIDNVYMMMTFATCILVLILFLVALLFINKFYNTRKLFHYLIALIALGIAFELIPYRSFILIAIVYLYELIFFDRSRESLKGFIMRQIPLLVIWIMTFYINPVFLLPEQLRYHPQQDINRYHDLINYKLFLYPLFTSTNILYGGLSYLFSQQNLYLMNKWITYMLSGFGVVSFSYFIYRFHNTEKKLTKIFIFSILYVYITCLSFYVYSDRVISETAFRYWIVCMPGYAMTITCVFKYLSLIFKNNILKYIPIIFLSLVFIVNIYATQWYISDFNSRSPYSKQITARLTELVPRLPKNSIIYFKPDENPDINYRLIDTFRGGHYDPRAYFGVVYHVKQEDIDAVVINYRDLRDMIKKDYRKKEKVVAFQYRSDGLHNITEEVKKSL